MVVVAEECWRITTSIMQHRLRWRGRDLNRRGFGLRGLVRFLCDGPLADLDFVLERFDPPQMQPAVIPTTSVHTKATVLTTRSRRRRGAIPTL